MKSTRDDIQPEAWGPGAPPDAAGARAAGDFGRALSAAGARCDGGGDHVEGAGGLHDGDCARAEADEEPAILEEIEVEDLTVDGICGVY